MYSCPPLLSSAAKVEVACVVLHLRRGCVSAKLLQLVAAVYESCWQQ